MTDPGKAERPNPEAPLLLTPGEPAGIGAEIALGAWRARKAAGVPTFALLDDPDRLAGLLHRLGWDVPLKVIDSPGEAEHVFPSGLPVLAQHFPVHVEPGHPSPENGASVLQAINRAVSLVRAGEAAALVTNPIAKSVLYQSGFRHPGHTEYLAALAADGGEAPMPVMMLACPLLRVVPITIHMPLREVPDQLTRGAIIHAGRVTAAALRRDFRLDNPRLALAGLNPHAGEGGAMGREEIEVMAPAVDALKTEGIAIQGPLSADTMFHAAARERYDAALCAYHDQALIPIKTLDFARGVNITLGLPFVRTSPDHGTAFAIAGTGEADPTSLIEALKTARALAEGRAYSMRAAVA
jgi:4-hydroxythreonine-4-phosphate dehydrogenase